MQRYALMTALALSAGWAAPASAQQARYCNGTLVANSFYSTVQTAGSTSTVEYHGQLQNQDTQRRVLTATMLPINRIGNFAVLRSMAALTLNSHQQRDVVVLQVQVSNPSGNGAPTPAQVGSQIRFSCAYR